MIHCLAGKKKTSSLPTKHSLPARPFRAPAISSLSYHTKNTLFPRSPYSQLHTIGSSAQLRLRATKCFIPKQHTSNSNFQFRSRSMTTKKNSSKKIGLFGDIHFQEKGLDRIQRTGDWIISEFLKHKVGAVVCLGDILNTRDSVSIPAQSAALRFFKKMRSSFPGEIHIILGNHDLHLKRDRTISSLDGLDFFTEHSKIFLHRDITTRKILDEKFLMIPYIEEAEEIQAYLQKLKIKKREEMITCGHLSINGAHVYSSKSSKYQGPLSSSHFQGFRRTFSGHFHLHQELNHNVMYVGSPLQFNFGDCGDTRGVVIYDISKDETLFSPNPHSDSFQIFTDSQVMEDNFFDKNASLIKDRFVLVQYKDAHTSLQKSQIKSQFLENGALSVKEESALSKIIKQSRDVIRSASNQELIEKFLHRLKETVAVTDLPVDLSEFGFEKTLLAGKQIIETVEKDTVWRDPNITFQAKLAHLTIENFLGVVGKREIPFSEMEDGVWTIEGPNGSGKSTILEAITWAQFGEFLRSDMVKDYAINDDSSQCRVFLEFSNGFAIERIRRRGKSDILKTYTRDETGELVYNSSGEKGTLKESQKVLEEKLGIDMSIFSRSCIMGQNIISNFVSGSKDERRQIIEGALGLEKFNLFYDQAREIRQREESELQVVNRLLNVAQTELNHLLQKKEKIQSQDEVRDLLLKKGVEMKQFQDLISQKMDQVKEKLKLNIKNTAELKETQVLAQSETPRKKLESLLTQLKEKIKFLEQISHKVETCPSCGQSMTHIHLEKIFGDVSLTLQSISALPEFSAYFWAPSLDHSQSVYLQELVKASEMVTEKIQALQNSERINTDLTNLAMQKLKLEKELLTYEVKLNSELNQMEKQMHSLQISAEQHIQLDEKVEQEKEKIAQLESSSFQKTQTFKMYKFWELVFDKKVAKASGLITLRRFVFEKTIEQLNLIFESYQAHFGEGRVVDVSLTPDLDFSDPYSKKSGGERKRIDLITLFSLHELIRQKSSYQSNYMILDEVFDSLDKNGQLSIQNLIEHLSESVEKVLVITHSDLISSINSRGTIRVSMKVDDNHSPLGSEFEIL